VALRQTAQQINIS